MYNVQNKNRVISLFIVIAIAFQSICFTGCSLGRNKRKTEIITEDTPWYESTTIEYDVFDNEDSIIPVVLTPQCKIYLKYHDGEEENENCVVYLFDGTKTEGEQISLNDYSSHGENVRLQNAFVDGDTPYLIFQNTIYKYSVSSKTLEKEFKVDFDGSNYFDANVGKVICRDGKLFVLFSYSLDPYLGLTEGENFYGFRSYLEDGTLESDFQTEDDIADWTVDKDGNIIYIYRTEDSDNNWKKVDLSTSNVDVDPIEDAIRDKYSTGVLMEDGSICMYSTVTTSINRYDLSTGEEAIIDFNYCDENLYSLSNNSLFYCNSEDLIIVKSTFFSGEFVSAKTIYELHKSDNNPNVGKKILVAAPDIDITFMEAEAVREYNKNSTDYYFYVSNAYSYDSVEKPDDVLTLDQIKAFNYQNIETRIDRITKDIEDGIGPDVILNFGQYPELNSSKTLINAKKVFTGRGSLDINDYFTNYIDAVEVEGKVYQMPLSVSVEGLYCKNDESPKDAAGFTFEEYQNYVDEYWGRFNPLIDQLGRNFYLNEVLYYSYCDIHNGEQLDEYCLGQVLDGVYEATTNNTVAGSPHAKWIVFENMAYDLERKAVAKDGYSLFGFPSKDASGPMARINESIGITTCTADEKEALKLVSYMLNTDVQSTNIQYNPINIEAFYTYADNAISYANAILGEAYYDENIIQTYKDVLDTADIPGYCDSKLTRIIYEEIHSYFDDDISRDELINIITSNY